MSLSLIVPLFAKYGLVLIIRKKNLFLDTDGNAVSLKRVSQITGKEVPFVFADCCKPDQLEVAFQKVSFFCKVR